MSDDAPARCDVVIVGGGPVGLLLAVLLAQRGFEPVVLERRTGIATRPKAVGVHAPGWRALESAGVAERLEPSSVAIVGGAVECDGRVLGRMRFPGDAAVRSVPQHLVEAALEARLAELRPGALRRGVEAVGVEAVGIESSSGAHSARAGVRVRLLDGAELAAEYAVLADGVRSRLRAELGIAWRLRRGSARYAMADVTGPEASGVAAGSAAEARLCFERDGVVEALPIPGGLRWVTHLGRSGGRRPDRSVSSVSAAPSASDWPDAAAFASLVADRVGARLPSDIEPSGFVARQRLAARFAVGRLALAGDAAHEISPIGGQGMSLGFRDAEELAEAVAGALTAASPSGGPAGAGASAPFAAYARRRRRAASRAIRRAAFNMAMGGPARGIRLALRNLAVRLLALPPARAALARVFTMRGL
ncbi:FAD-dependent oxidoreductase [Agromyces mediolanus]|uniref:2-polyprenyl-6-methoxyphenol hydroxylase n=1 Tax=Agromyces mediolanus TaxID=41986 RepID=A0A918CDD4_AGRME|nr:NAD(P)/FAD-dependent oxidoreductase [Agromyces mediolanus]GGR18632.1 2-polyprenyl-6-methoxyphenol hydroxylase [Agromyces mediolanus]GLJ71416.1 2-polyprenyl-6-methoxyphenol hydroxylase [Agromyces mediolanus]